jgi:hypothetical protein
LTEDHPQPGRIRTPFSITSGFQTSINTLTFAVPNGTELNAGPQGPTGLQVDITSARATPEPGSLTLLGLGIAGLVGDGWRRRKQAARVAG